MKLSIKISQTLALEAICQEKFDFVDCGRDLSISCQSSVRTSSAV